MGFAGCSACAGDGLGLRLFGRGSEGGIPVEDAAATVAGEQLAFAELVPHLRANTHAAAEALLIDDESEAGAAGCVDAIEADEPLGVNVGTEGIALQVEGFNLGCEFLLPSCDARLGFLKGAGKNFNLGAGLGEQNFLRLSALEACELFIFEAIGLGGGELNLVFDGGCLFRSLDGVKLRAEVRSLLSTGGDFAVETDAQGLLSAEGLGGLSGSSLTGGKSSVGLSELSGQSARFLSDAIAVQLYSLEFYEVLS